MAKRKPDAKKRIIEAAIDCFTEKGIVGTTFKDIALKAKVHQPLISYYFKNFNELFASVIGVLLEDLKTESIAAVSNNYEDPYNALIEYSEVPLKWAQAKPHYTAIWTFFYHMASYEEYFRSLNKIIREGGRDRISLLLFKIQESRQAKLTEGWTIADLAMSLQAQITGAMVLALTENQDLKLAQKNCGKTIAAFIDSVFI